MSKPNNRPQYVVKIRREIGDKTRWTTIGAAFKNEQGGYTIDLAAHPIDNRVYLYPPTDRDDADKPASSK